MPEIETEHGKIAYLEKGSTTESATIPLVFIHGNSSAKEIFARQMGDAFGDNRRLIALDLPGHGQSDNARDPHRTYGIDGFADALISALEGIGVSEAVIVGWSLGGHIALEMAGRWPGAKGVVITGTPPVGADPQDMASAFLPTPHMELTFKPEFTEAEARTYAQETLGEDQALEEWMVAACCRADGRFRTVMIETAMEGRSLDQKEIVRTSPVPLAVLEGELDPFVSLDYLKGLTYANIWRGEVQVLTGLSHAPFWQDADRFNGLLNRFLEEVAL